jgi:hypothetical protein
MVKTGSLLLVKMYIYMYICILNNNLFVKILKNRAAVQEIC